VQKNSSSKVLPWQPSSWRERPAQQAVAYPDPRALAEVLAELARRPPLVASGEVDELQAQIARAAQGRAFILQGGDCVERFIDCDEAVITNKLKILLQMSVILTHSTRCPVVRIGRIAGQYAKPRSQSTEIVDGEEILTYRGDSIHDFTPTRRGRTPDPSRLLQGYFLAASTLNFIRSMIDGGFADLHQPYNWNLYGIEKSAQWPEYKATVERILDAIHFMESFGGVNPDKLQRVSFYTSHEALHLPYEESLTRLDARSGRYYNLGAHMVWVGERTRHPDGAHAEYLRGIANPIGIKVGPAPEPTELVRLLDTINPSHEVGRITLITRLGRQNVAAHLPTIVEAVRGSGHVVAWSCDPMHGNTVALGGRKTRLFEAVLEDLRATFACHESLGNPIAGVHFELTGDDVSECIGGSVAPGEQDLSRNYQTYCDPRLNYDQSLEMAFLIASTLSSKRQAAG
jgi:3-deoxy-7-phosphoheptulonate synthase